MGADYSIAQVVKKVKLVMVDILRIINKWATMDYETIVNMCECGHEQWSHAYSNDMCCRGNCNCTAFTVVYDFDAPDEVIGEVVETPVLVQIPTEEEMLAYMYGY